MSNPGGRPEDAVIAALDDDAALFSDIAEAIEAIVARQPPVEIRRELWRIIDAIVSAREIRIAGRAAYRKTRK